MSEIPEKTQQLIKALEEIARALKYGIHGAEAMPGQFGRDAENLYIRHSNDFRYCDEGLKNTVEVFKAKIVSHERARGELERKRILTNLAALLEAHRVALPALAAASCIELGIIARNITEKK